MAVEKSYTRLGIFIVVVLVVILATAVLFIQRLSGRAVIGLVTYTKESVSGLDVASPVRFRGVRVGRVTDIRVDPRGNLIEINFEMFLDRLATIGVDVARVRQHANIVGIFPHLRARIIGNPVTGEAHLLVDLPQKPPPPIDLGFTPDRPYVPSMSSTFASVQDRLPAVLERAELTLQSLREIIDRVPGSLGRSDRFFSTLERTVQKSDVPALSADARTFFSTSTAQMEQMRSDSAKFFAATTAQIEQMRSDLDVVIGAEGALVKLSEEARAAIKAADFPAVNQSARDAAENSRLAADDLRRSMPAIRDSLEQLRELARMLEDQPESIVHGPRPPKMKRP